MQIKVTQEDIRHGKLYDCRRCPIALAITRAIPDLEYLSVSPYSVSLTRKGATRVYTLNKEAREFITSFDSGMNPKPITFTLR